MIHKNTIRYSLYTTAGILILTLTGIFSTFEGRTIIEDYLDFDTVILTIMLAGTAILTALPVRERGVAPAIVNGILSALIVSGALAVLVILIDTDVTGIRFMFQNLSEHGLNQGTLTFGRDIAFEGWEPRAFLLPLLYGGGTALVAALWASFARQLRNVVLAVAGLHVLAILILGGLTPLLLFAVIVGGASGLLVIIPKRLRNILLTSAGLLMVLGLTIDQLDDVMALPDALALLVVFSGAYGLGLWMTSALSRHLAAGFAAGATFALVLALIANNGGLEKGGLLRGIGSMPIFLEMTLKGWWALLFVLLMGAFGAAGTLVSGASRNVHSSIVYFVTGLVVLGILNWQDDMNLLAALLVYGVLCLAFWFVPELSAKSDASFVTVSVQEKRAVHGIFAVMVLVILLAAPQFMGVYLSNVFNFIALYTIMGIGLNVMIGYAGLLDLGYVAAFAIGAYTLGVLTTPNLLTCGGVHPNDIPLADLEATCTGIINFWWALPFCVFFSAVTGTMLGVPVLRLRGDYLAIVTLGFGEIMNRVVLSDTFKPLLGGPQGISPIPSPRVDLSGINSGWVATFSTSSNIYYLYLFAVAITAFVVYRLANSRTGRAWRAVKADEDVAQAMGIELVRTKLLAFGVSSAFAGLGGAIFAGMLQGIFPNSFTLLVSINVLSLIIIGGMGSISGVFVGALLLVGLPELLRELESYRMLSFGALLVTVMLIKREGLLPPRPPELSEAVSAGDTEKGEQ